MDCAIVAPNEHSFRPLQIGLISPVGFAGKEQALVPEAGGRSPFTAAFIILIKLGTEQIDVSNFGQEILLSKSSFTKPSAPNEYVC
jgi:hypothetical protein